MWERDIRKEEKEDTKTKVGKSLLVYYRASDLSFIEKYGARIFLIARGERLTPFSRHPGNALPQEASFEIFLISPVCSLAFSGANEAKPSRPPDSHRPSGRNGTRRRISVTHSVAVSRKSTRELRFTEIHFGFAFFFHARPSGLMPKYLDNRSR